MELLNIGTCFPKKRCKPPSGTRLLRATSSSAFPSHLNTTKTPSRKLIWVPPHIVGTQTARKRVCWQARCYEDEGLGLVWGDVELDQVGFETLCFGGAVGYSYGHPDGAEEHGVVA